MGNRISEEEVSRWAKDNGKCIVDIEFYNQMMAESFELSKYKIVQAPKRIEHYDWGDFTHYECINCGKKIIRSDNYCRKCGVRLKEV